MSESPFHADERGLIVRCPGCRTATRLTYGRLGRHFRCPVCQSDIAPPAGTLPVWSEPVFDALVSGSALPVLIDFWAPWCGPCRVVAPELEQVARTGANRWLVAKVNTEELPGLARRFGVASIPTLALFRAGREIAREAGALPARRILDFMEPHLST